MIPSQTSSEAGARARLFGRPRPADPAKASGWDVMDAALDHPTALTDPRPGGPDD